MINVRRSVLLAFAVAQAACSNDAHAGATPALREAAQPVEALAHTATGTSHVTIPIEGMACDSCAERLERQLAALDGVLEATVDFDKKQATLKFDPKKMTVKKLVAEINRIFTAGEPKKDGEA